MDTVTDAAENAGVSITTVLDVINNTRFVSDEVRQRVQEAKQVLGYHQNTLARSLRRGETKTLGMILPDSGNPYFTEIGHAIESVTFEQGYSIVLCNTENDQDKEHLYTEVLVSEQVDGMIFVVAGEETDSLSDLIQKNIPVIVVDRELTGIEVDSVLSDNYQGGRLATQHLVDLNHKRIGCITGPSHINPSSKCVAGYQAVLEEAGIKYDAELILRGDFHPESGSVAARKLLQFENRPTVIFACNDLLAIGVIRAAMELGLRVPDDLAVIGKDDIDLFPFSGGVSSQKNRGFDEKKF